MKTILMVYLLLANLAAFALMGTDKRRAQRCRWRIPEKTLFRKLEQTLDSLPELLAKLPHTDGSTRPQVSTEEPSEPKKLNPLDEGYMDALREELENLTGQDLVNRRFTDDQLKAINEWWEAQHHGQQTQQPTQKA